MPLDFRFHRFLLPCIGMPILPRSAQRGKHHHQKRGGDIDHHAEADRYRHDFQTARTLNYGQCEIHTGRAADPTAASGKRFISSGINASANSSRAKSFSSMMLPHTAP